jgi:integrase
MGALIQIWKTIPIPAGAVAGQDGTIKWFSQGKIKTGKLSGTNRVSVQSDTWTAQFSDETGKVRRVSTHTVNRSVAERILAQHEKEIDRIKAGIITREELDKVQVRQTPLKKLLKQFRKKMTASGKTPSYINLTMQELVSVFDDCRIDSIEKFRRETVDQWIANEVQRKVRSIGTINCYLIAVKVFAQYLTDRGALDNNPFRTLRKLDAEQDRRKIRRALTPEEVDRFLQAAASGKNYHHLGVKDRVLIYRWMLGTGLWSAELSLLTPGQIDFEHCCITVKSGKTKGKQDDVLPLRADLAESLKERITVLGIEPHERIFHHDKQQLLSAFYKDLKAAGIERAGADGRSVDIHSLRKTFGTMLAMAKVPLITVQRLMRHSTPVLTAQLYLDIEPIDMIQALKQLPVYRPTFRVIPLMEKGLKVS